MLTTLKKYAKNIIGLGLIAILVLAFIVWGIADVWTGNIGGRLAKVGDENITQTQYLEQYRRQMQYLTREQRGLTRDEAISLGLPNQVLGQMVVGLLYKEFMQEIGLALGNEGLGAIIQKNSQFFGQNNEFSRAQFNRMLREVGLREKDYLDAIRNEFLINQLVSATNNISLLPSSYIETIHQYIFETRDGHYISISPDAVASDILSPNEKRLRDFYDNSPDLFFRQEQRDIVIMHAALQEVAATTTISNEDLLEAYDRNLSQYLTKERRDIDQLIFRDEAEAEKATALLAEGEPFEKIIEMLGHKKEDVDLGSMAKDDFLSQELADFAFSLKQGEVSKPFDGPFGTLIFHIRSITAEKLKTFEEVSEELQTNLLNEYASEDLYNRAQEIDVKRDEGAILIELAQENGFNIEVLDKITLERFLKEQPKRPFLSGLEGLGELVFSTEVGDLLPYFESDNGDIYWVEINQIIPRKKLTFEEAKSDVALAWRAKQQNDLLNSLARDLIKKGNEGIAFEVIAQEADKTIITKEGIGRNDGDDVFSQEAIAKLFITPLNRFFTAPIEGTDDILIAQTAKITSPAKPKPKTKLKHHSEKDKNKIDALKGEKISEEGNEDNKNNEDDNVADILETLHTNQLNAIRIGLQVQLLDQLNKLIEVEVDEETFQKLLNRL